MGQTTFPGILVEEIEVRKNVTPRGNFGRGVGMEFNVPELGADITPRRIREVLEELGFGVTTDDVLIYRMLVKGASRPTATAKARGFVRLKNPFEPDVLNVKRVEDATTEGIIKAFRIWVEVSK